jgi:hypothetical protein
MANRVKEYERENGRGGIQDQITQWNKKQLHLFESWKIHADNYGNAGKWDNLLIFNDGHHMWVEVKTETGELSDLQVLWGQALWARNCDMVVVRSLSEHIDRVRYYLDNRQRGSMPVELEKKVMPAMVRPSRLHEDI